MASKDDRSLFSSSRGRVRVERSIGFIDANKEIESNAREGCGSGKAYEDCKSGKDCTPCTDDKPRSMKVLYFRWLLNKLDKKQTKKYASLLLHLFKESFMEHESVPMDVNRARDGVALRKHFINSEECYGDDQLEGIKYDDCSWLEMLIALAERIDDQIMFDMNIGNRTNQWFWLIIEQMELDNYDEYHYKYDEVKRILRNFELRRYKNEGRDGIFKCKKDVSRVEIWYQMNEWFNENSPKVEF